MSGQQLQRLIGSVLNEDVHKSVKNRCSHWQLLCGHHLSTGRQGSECEPAAHRKIETRNAPICCVHGAEHVEVLRDAELRAAINNVLQSYRSRVRASNLACLEEIDRLAKDLAEVRSVDLIDEQQVGRRRLLGLEHGIEEPAASNFETET